MELQQDVDLSALNTLALPSRARYFVRARSEQHIEEAVNFALETAVPLFVLGSGSNLVLSPTIDGLVLQVANRGITQQHDDPRRVCFTAAAGENWHGLVVQTLDRGWCGLENLALIPGTLGAAPVQNIGAYGVELDRFVVAVRAFDLTAMAWLDLSRDDCAFAYRDSVFRHGARQRYIISTVTLQLARPHPLEIGYAALRAELEQRGLAQPTAQDVFDAVVAIRSSKLPNPAVLPNAGSFFKNPLVSEAHHRRLQAQFPGIVAHPQVSGGVKLAAGWLIDQAGLKGRAQAGVGMHRQQALVLVNYGGAGAREVLACADQVCATVLRKFGVELEREPLVIASDGSRS